MNEEKGFEEEIARVEEIIKKLEDGSPSLEATLELYQEGVERLVKLEKRLEEAELKIEKIEEKGRETFEGIE